MLISMITSQKERLQQRILESMVKQRNLLTSHMKDVAQKQTEINEILESAQGVE